MIDAFLGSWKKLRDKISPSQRVILCPFHEEKSPSMVITEDTYYCLSCGESGNTKHIQNYIDWIEKI